MSANAKGVPGSKMPTGRDSRALLLRAITFLGGIYFFLYFIAPEALIEQLKIKQAHQSISNGFIAVGAMAIGLGIINIIASHGMRVVFGKKGWHYSVALLLGMCVMIGVTIAQWRTMHEVSQEIRKVQVIGDFATRIIEDVKAEPGKHLSVSSSGVLPPLSDRVGALIRYAQATLDDVTRTTMIRREEISRDESLEKLHGELSQGAFRVQELLTQMRARAWSRFDPEGEDFLKSVAQHSAQLGATYAIIKRKESSEWLSSRLYDFFYNGLFNHLGASMFALLGVYIAAAAYRAFRIQSIESALMMTAALVVMLGQISFGKLVYSDMPAIRQWLLEVPNSAAFRAIRLGAGVAGLMLAIRMWLSLETRKRGGQR